MTWITEDPWPLLVMGLTLQAMLLVAFFQTRRGLFLAGMLVAGLTSGGLFIAERMIVTEREEVELVLQEVADALVRDDRQGVLDRISPYATHVRAQAEGAMRIFRVTNAKIGNDLVITLNQLTSPPSATAIFLGRLDVESRLGGYQQPVVRRFTLTFSQEEDGWYIANYEHRGTMAD